MIRTQIDYCKYLYMVFGRLKNYFQTPFLVEKLRFLIGRGSGEYVLQRRT